MAGTTFSTGIQSSHQTNSSEHVKVTGLRSCMVSPVYSYTLLGHFAGFLGFTPTKPRRPASTFTSPAHPQEMMTSSPHVMMSPTPTALHSSLDGLVTLSEVASAAQHASILSSLPKRENSLQSPPWTPQHTRTSQHSTSHCQGTPSTAPPSTPKRPVTSQQVTPQRQGIPRQGPPSTPQHDRPSTSPPCNSFSIFLRKVSFTLIFLLLLRFVTLFTVVVVVVVVLLYVHISFCCKKKGHTSDLRFIFSTAGEHQLLQH